MRDTADTLRNVILSCHSIRDARNLSHECTDCCYCATGACLTAGKQHQHIYITLDTFQTNGAHDHDNHQGPQSHHTSSPADTPLCTVGKSKQRNVLSYCAAPQQLWIIYCYAKCAQISELEAIITVRRPHRQRMSSAANALLCNIGEGKHCNLLSYFSALQHLCGTRSC